MLSLLKSSLESLQHSCSAPSIYFLTPHLHSFFTVSIPPTLKAADPRTKSRLIALVVHVLCLLRSWEIEGIRVSCCLASL